jgi:hypothetical protein
VPAVLLQAAPSPTTAADALFGNPLVPSWWTAPDGRTRTGRIWVSPGLAAGRTARLWVQAAGSLAGPSASYRARVADEALAAAVAPVVLGIVLWWLAWAGRWVLDRRRLADWEAAYGPLSDPSGASASGRKASPDGRKRHHKAAQAHRAADHRSARPASSCRSGEQ